jgi:hypothetical protein
MTPAEQLIDRVQIAGGELGLRGDRIHCVIPEDEAHLLDELRTHKAEVLSLLRSREEIPAIPPSLHLVSWNLKDPPVAIETCAVVIAPALFARSTLEQLRVALENPRRWVGWTPQQLIDRLAQVGVEIEILKGEKP